jgi:hypothetical protein
VEGVVEGEFVGPLISGETLLRYRILPHQHAVLPCTAQGLIGGGDDIEIYRSLAQWWRQAEEIWTRHRSKERLSPKEQLDYQSKLTKQLPIPTLRVVYIASGMHLTPPTLPHAQSYWRTTSHQVFFVPRIKFIDRIQNSLPDLDVSWSYSHRSPVP